MKHAIPFLFLLAGACSSSPNFASTSAAGAGGAAGDSMSNLFGGQGGSGSVTLADGGTVVSGNDGSVSPDGGIVSGNDGSVSPDGGIVSADAGLDAGADAGSALDPECEGIKFPEPGCRCAGFEAHAFFFCPGPLDNHAAFAACLEIPGFYMIGVRVPSVLANAMAVEFIRGLSGEVVWTPGAPTSCYVLTTEGQTYRKSADCSEPHAYVCEEQL